MNKIVGDMAPSYKMRLFNEYHITKDRYNKLHEILVKYDAGTLVEFTPKDGSIEWLRKQAEAMGRYLYTLEVRAEIEGFVLNPSPTGCGEEEAE